jgi:hypothetical protein
MPVNLKELGVTRSALGERVGWLWPVVLLKAMHRRKALLTRTRWSGIAGAEADFVRRLSITPALYNVLETRMGRDEAFEVMKGILLSIGCREQWDHLNAMDPPDFDDMERLRAFNELMDREGTPRFNRRECVRQDENVCHFRITRCVFSDFFNEAGTPDLTKSFCEVDRRFFPEAFPDLVFHRGDSWENTIAYGRDHCEFVFERKTG